VDELLDESYIAEPECAPALAAATVTRGVFAGVDDSGRPRVVFATNPSDEPVAAMNATMLTRADIGKTVILSFEDGDPLAPVILGVVQPVTVIEAGPNPKADAVVDGERVVIGASREIVLRCGDASLTLTRDGRVMLRGRYVLSRATDVHRIKGGSVQIN